MVEVLKKSIGFKTECGHCGSILKFDRDDMGAIPRGPRNFLQVPGPVSII